MVCTLIGNPKGMNLYCRPTKKEWGGARWWRLMYQHSNVYYMLAFSYLKNRVATVLKLELCTLSESPKLTPTSPILAELNYTPLSRYKELSKAFIGQLRAIYEYHWIAKPPFTYRNGYIVDFYNLFCCSSWEILPDADGRRGFEIDSKSCKQSQYSWWS